MTGTVSVLTVSVFALGLALRLALSASRRSAVGDRLPQPAAASGRRGGGLRLRPPAPPSWLEPALADADIGIAPATVWGAWLVGMATVGAAALVGSGPAGAALALVVGCGLPRLALRSRRGRADSRIEGELPVALEAIARSLRSGASVRQAIGEAAGGGGGGHLGAIGGGPGGGGGGLGAVGGGGGLGAGGGGGRGAIGQGGHPRLLHGHGRRRLQVELAAVADQAGHGRGLADALEGLAARRPSPGVRLAVAALCLGLDTGGAQARAIDGVAATLRERLAIEAEARALSSQARMSALVIGLAPLGFGAFAAATDPRTSDFLLRTPIGLTLVAVGLLLDGVGWMWMQRLCRVTA